MSKVSWVRTIYLYTFSLVGLVLIIISAVSFIDMGLKAFVFTKADAPYSYGREAFPSELDSVETKSLKGAINLNADQEKKFDEWFDNNRSEEVDYAVRNRHQTASRSLSLLLVGIVLYWYHWKTIQKERKEKE